MQNENIVVVKIGSSTLTHGTGHLNLRRLNALAETLADIKNAGVKLVLVSSGAIAVGVGKLGLKARPDDISTKQAAAAVGQCELMYIYDELFARYNHTVAQVLLTSGDIGDPDRRRYIENTLNKLLEMDCLPIINENDTVAVNEIVIGDNDRLSAIVAKLLGARLLVLVSDIDGLYSADPHTDPAAELIPVVTDLESAKQISGGAGSALGTGGMATKIDAASVLKGSGTDMVVINGDDPSNIYLAVEGKPIGTFFPAKG